MPHPLDNIAYVTRNDPKGMYRLTVDFPSQCRRALELADQADVDTHATDPRLAMLTGLGGSAAGGDLVRAMFEAEGTIPFIVNRDYELPHYVGLGDLVFCASYSGNTEETLSAYQEALGNGCRIIVVTSGGKLSMMAELNKHLILRIPAGQPPRTALGYMFVPVLRTCERMGLLPEHDYQRTFSLLDSCAKTWGADVPFEQNQAKQIAQEMHGKVSVIYGLGSWQGIVANRWRAQINENAKNLAFPYVFPELNHNEILGWVKADEQGVASWLCVLLDDVDLGGRASVGKGSEDPIRKKMNVRARVTEELLAGRARFLRVRPELHQSGSQSLPPSSNLDRILALCYLGDFVSLYLAALNGVDPENIDWINTLKGELASA